MQMGGKGENQQINQKRAIKILKQVLHRLYTFTHKGEAYVWFTLIILRIWHVKYIYLYCTAHSKFFPFTWSCFSPLFLSHCPALEKSSQHWHFAGESWWEPAKPLPTPINFSWELENMPRLPPITSRRCGDAPLGSNRGLWIAYEFSSFLKNAPQPFVTFYAWNCRYFQQAGFSITQS